MTFINSQKGSVLVIILVAVALFAALSYTVANMMRGGAEIGSEKAGIYASEILTYAQSVGEAVKIILTAALIIAAIRVLNVEMLPFMIGYISIYIVYWVALKTGLPGMTKPG